jgi:hypothetical protein
MEPIYGKRVDATPIDMSTRVLLVDEEADVDASLREVPEQMDSKLFALNHRFQLWLNLSLLSTI